MTTSSYMSFERQIEDLKASLISDGKQDYLDYRREDHHRALGFRVLASANLEHFVEDRCRVAASDAVENHLKRRPNRASKCLLIWHSVGKWEEIPVETSELTVYDRVKFREVLNNYHRSIDKMHGIDGRKLRQLLIPLGFRTHELDEYVQLFDRLDALADQRNQAAHIRVNRMKQMQLPIQEYLAINRLMNLLKSLDADLEKISNP
ncbi:HEPN domain-containing protein [Nocardia sp. NPDC050193]